jgi:hypothetical protein
MSLSPEKPASPDAEVPPSLPVPHLVVLHGDRKEPQKTRVNGRHAYLVDACWPEFEAYVAARRRRKDILAVPHATLEDTRWSADGFGTVHASSLLGLLRARELEEQAHLPGATLRTHFKYADLIARSYCFLLGRDVDEVTVAQDLLPALHRSGVLRGRAVDVLLTRTPLHLMHARLDAAAHRHPLSFLLAAYRVDHAEADDEALALSQARRIITPHAELARLFGPRAVRLPWMLPEKPRWRPGDDVALAGACDGRHGAYEVRDLARATGLQVTTLGPPLEYIAFWRGVDVLQKDPGGNWLDGVGVAVLPAWVCNQPRAALAAVAAGCPVVASAACGLTGLPHVTEIPTGDEAALAQAVHALRAVKR